MILALLLAGSTVVLRDDTSTVPPHHRWRYDRFEITGKQLPVDVDCSFKVEKGSHVHIELMSEDNLEALRKGEKYEAIQSANSGGLHQEIGLPGTFAIVVWNDDDAVTAEVALKLSLDFSGKSLNNPRTLSQQRKLSVILLSFVGFLTILTVSARQLLKGMASRAAAESASPRSSDEPEATTPTAAPGPDIG